MGHNPGGLSEKPSVLAYTKKQPFGAMAGGLRLSKRWLTPRFRRFHGSLAPKARPGSHAEKPLLRKAFCGFSVYTAKSE